MDFCFRDAEQALMWSVEVLRRRRLPKLTAMWREVLPEAEFVARSWEGECDGLLGLDAHDRLDVALKVEKALDSLAQVEKDGARLLRLWAWGDWADEGRLRAALAIQERCRRDGMRVRIAYRYTYAQLGMALGCDKKTAWRRVQEALQLLGRELALAGLLDHSVGEVPEAGDNKVMKSVRFADFRGGDEESA